MKNFKLFTLALLTTFLFSCENENVDIANSTIETAQNAELGAKNPRIQHLKNLSYILAIRNVKGKVIEINIEANDISAFGGGKNRFINYYIDTQNELPKRFTEPGLKSYTFISRRRLKNDTEINFDYSIVGGTPFSYNFTRQLKKGEKVAVARDILPRDAKSTTEINITLE